MRRKIKRHILVPAALLVYIIIMVVMAFPRYQEQGNWNEFFLIVGIALAMIVVLFFVLKRREKIRDNFTKKSDQ